MAQRTEQISLHLNAYLSAHSSPPDAVLRELANETAELFPTETGLQDDVPTGVQADGRQILLYRHDGTLYALDNLCSHAAGLLSRGAVEGLTVTCPLHGSQYCLADGSVRRGPSHQPQPVIRTRVRNGWIEVRGNQPATRRRSANGRK